MYTFKEHNRMMKLIINSLRFYHPGYVPIEIVLSKMRITKKNANLFYRVLGDLMTSGHVQRSVIEDVACYRLNA